ncbi:MAG: hypothetical protein WDZ76_08860 [Pseudohongiellaceae bacterium]
MSVSAHAPMPICGCIFGRRSNTSTSALRPLVKSRAVSSDNTSDRDDAIGGLNSTWSVGEGKTDVYYLGLKRHEAVYVQGIADETRHSAGMR